MAYHRKRDRAVTGSPITRKPRPQETDTSSDYEPQDLVVEEEVQNLPATTRRPRGQRPVTSDSKTGDPLSTTGTQPTLGKAVRVPRPDRPVNGTIPPCKVKGRNFCVLTNDYPMDVVSRVVDDNIHKVKVLYEELHTVADPELFPQHIDDGPAGKGDFACDTKSEELQVGWARDAVSKEWMVVVNTDHFPQKVQVEKCLQPREPCRAIDALFESTCQQRFSLHRLIAFRPWDPESSPVVSLFKFPAGCSCRVARRASSRRRRGRIE
ncbi:neurotrophin 1-like [Galendromus occidentalis]|uniref:Neurotrophin 1-like n=1 Tax=Galendromus occidentalis TaxID=34638 RepID=A0AAJ7SFD6_9ACAR|nr:neurotrophin 1-like [Galendromus occidentalis]